jgi:hypothetical protein
LAVLFAPKSVKQVFHVSSVGTLPGRLEGDSVSWDVSGPNGRIASPAPILSQVLVVPEGG